MAFIHIIKSNSKVMEDSIFDKLNDLETTAWSVFVRVTANFLDSVETENYL
jgi:hypothetical protein